MPFLLRSPSGGVRGFRHRLADDQGVTFCDSTTDGTPSCGLRLSHERHEYLEGRGRIVQVNDTIYRDFFQQHRRQGGEGAS